MYLDQGYEPTKTFIHKTLLVTFEEILKTGSWMDPKSRYQEYVQSNEGFTPSYKVLTEEGPDHEKIFTVGVFVEGDLRGSGTGPSKQIAQIKAADAALAAAKK